MTKNEKLNHFYDVTIADANKQRKEILDNYQENLDKEYNRYVEDKNLKTKNDIEVRSAIIRRDINREFSTESLEIKHALSKEQNELKDSLMKEVVEKLLKFKETPEYFDYLVKLANAVKDFAGYDDVDIYLDKSDEALASELSKATGKDVLISEEELTGGIMARIEEKNILIDNSFKSAVREQKENFNFEGERE